MENYAESVIQNLAYRPADFKELSPITRDSFLYLTSQKRNAKLETSYFLILPSTNYCLLPSSYSLLPTTAHPYFLLPTPYFLLPTPNSQLPTSFYLLPTPFHLLPTSSYQLPTSSYLLPTSSYLLPTSSSSPFLNISSVIGFI